MSRNAIITTVVSVVVVIGFLFMVYTVSNKPSSPTGETINTQVNTINESDHVKWSPEKKNVLVEYADIQCPACQQFHFALKTYEASGSADADIPKNITYVFRHFPLTTIHKNALGAAYAAEAAGLQGKFFEMVDLLFTNQEEWSDLGNPAKYFEDMARELELDVSKFNTDSKSDAVKNRVQADLNSGRSAGANSTPTFYLNGRKVEVTSFDDFKNLLKNPGS